MEKNQSFEYFCKTNNKLELLKLYNREKNKEKKQYDFYSSFHYFAYFMDLRLQRLCKPRTEERVLMPRCSQSSQPFDCKTTKNSIKNDSANPGNRSPRVQL